MIKSAYIHIPFCSRKCNYCSFVSYDTLTLKSVYLDALLSEIKNSYNKEPLDTLYFGGGTPSTFSISDFTQVFDLLNFEENAEITVEINPENVSKEYLKDLRALGVNRLSIGVQVFEDKVLKIIGRNHSVSDVLKTVKNAKNVGFENISIDLIYGLPTQDMDLMEKSLNKAIDLDVQHISLYGLKIEEGCSFYNHRPDFLPDNDDQAQMYLRAVEKLSDNGFNHYEISNFSKNGCESRHNLKYWKNENYYGFGVAACGYEQGVRYKNQTQIEKYLQNPLAKISKEKLTQQEKLEEEIFLGFRLLKGLNIDEVNQKYSIDFDKKYKNTIEKYLASNHLQKDDKGYKLSINGILLSNNILSEFID